jgi:hypothetical protein
MINLLIKYLYNNRLSVKNKIFLMQVTQNRTSAKKINRGSRDSP